MSLKYKCPLCDEIYADEDEAAGCRDECAALEYRVIEIDTMEDAKSEPEKFVGKCETCHNSDEKGNSLSSCPHHGCDIMPDGCDSYELDTLTFGTGIETLWREQRGTV